MSYVIEDGPGARDGLRDRRERKSSRDGQVRSEKSAATSAWRLV